jgi:hypothetical protein
MRFLRTLRSALGVALRRQRFEDGVADELRFHIDAYRCSSECRSRSSEVMGRDIAAVAMPG